MMEPRPWAWSLFFGIVVGAWVIIIIAAIKG